MSFFQRVLERLSHQRLNAGDDPTSSVADYSQSFAGELAALRSHRDSLRDHEIHFMNCGDNPRVEYINSIRAELTDMANNMMTAAKRFESLEKAIARKAKQQGRGLWQQYGDGFGDSDDDHVY